jgi:hypothetical protein
MNSYFFAAIPPTHVHVPGTYAHCHDPKVVQGTNSSAPLAVFEHSFGIVVGVPLCTLTESMAGAHDGSRTTCCYCLVVVAAATVVSSKVNATPTTATTIAAAIHKNEQQP